MSRNVKIIKFIIFYKPVNSKKKSRDEKRNCAEEQINDCCGLLRVKNVIWNKKRNFVNFFTLFLIFILLFPPNCILHNLKKGMFIFSVLLLFSLLKFLFAFWIFPKSAFRFFFVFEYKRSRDFYCPIRPSSQKSRFTASQ